MSEGSSGPLVNMGLTTVPESLAWVAAWSQRGQDTIMKIHTHLLKFCGTMIIFLHLVLVQNLAKNGVLFYALHYCRHHRLMDLPPTLESFQFLFLLMFTHFISLLSTISLEKKTLLMVSLFFLLSHSSRFPIKKLESRCTETYFTRLSSALLWQCFMPLQIT